MRWASQGRIPWRITPLPSVSGWILERGADGRWRRFDLRHYLKHEAKKHRKQRHDCSKYNSDTKVRHADGYFLRFAGASFGRCSNEVAWKSQNWAKLEENESMRSRRLCAAIFLAAPSSDGSSVTYLIILPNKQLCLRTRARVRVRVLLHRARPTSSFCVQQNNIPKMPRHAAEFRSISQRTPALNIINLKTMLNCGRLWGSLFLYLHHLGHPP